MLPDEVLTNPDGNSARLTPTQTRNNCVQHNVDDAGVGFKLGQFCEQRW